MRLMREWPGWSSIIAPRGRLALLLGVSVTLLTVNLGSRVLATNDEARFPLLARDILVDYRPKAGIRLSPHFYNRDEEIDFALAQIEEILATRAWERHLQVV